MRLVPWSPFWLREELEEMMDDYSNLPAKSSNFVLPVDIYETAKTVEVKIPIAGVDPEKVDISVKDNVLTVKGQTEKKTEVEDKNYYRKEIRSGSFHRSLPLPVGVIGEKASAAAEHGMLKISIPKTEEKKAKPVKVKVKKSGKSKK